MNKSLQRKSDATHYRASFLDSSIEEALGLTALQDPDRLIEDIGLRFHVEVLGLDHLHYGLWQGEPLTLDGLRVAQQRYTDTLADLFPDSIKSVLDVGCGIGANAAVFAARGYEVEGLSPDPFHGHRFREATGLPFHQFKFEDFHPARRYDLICMSESCQYVPLDRLFESVLAAVKPGGYLILSDYFALVKDGSPAVRSGHLLSAFLTAAENSGMQIEFERDVTDETAPSLDLVCLLLDQYAFPALRLALQRWQRKSPRLLKIGLWFARRRFEKLEARKETIDGRLFREKKTYRMYRFRAPNTP